MTVEPRSWQPAMTGCNHMIWIGDEEGNCMECEAVLIWVVPDTRPQAIADAWNELLSDEQEYIVEQFPQLEPLSDALTEEKT